MLSSPDEQWLQKWLFHLVVGRQAAYMALLLSLISSLRFLHITCAFNHVGHGGSIRPLWEFLNMQKYNPAVVPNLREVVVEGDRPGTLKEVVKPSLDAVLSMPSISKVRLRPAHVPIWSAEAREEMNWSANITYLDLENAFMTNSMMDIISTRLVKLQHFRFTWRLGYRDAKAVEEARAPYGAQSIIRALDARAYEPDPVLPMETLSGLTKLEVFEVTPRLLLGDGPAKHCTAMSVRNRRPTEDASLTAEQQGGSDFDPLPVGLGSLILHSPQPGEYSPTIRWLQNMLDNRDVWTPRLNVIDISAWGFSAALCYAMTGILVAIHEHPKLRQKLRLPPWFVEVFKHILLD